MKITLSTECIILHDTTIEEVNELIYQMELRTIMLKGKLHVYGNAQQILNLLYQITLENDVDLI